MSLTAAEQYLLELINRARLDPVAEAARYSISLNEGLAPGTLTGGSRQVLAYNAQLGTAATRHTDWMLSTDIFSHSGAGGSSPGDRAEASGYDWNSYGENISWRGSTGSINIASMIPDHHEGLFLSSGHRVNILAGHYREIGIGHEGGNFSGYNASMLTELFGSSGARSFLTGVAYTDSNRDGFYSMGEGRGGVDFAIGSQRTATASAGGYAIGVTPANSVDVSGSVGTLRFTLEVDLRAGNVKLDVVNGNIFYTSGSVTLGTGIHDVKLLGLNGLSVTGSSAANDIFGNAGNNALAGGGGNDMIRGATGADRIFGDGGSDRLYGDQQNDILRGGLGNDRLFGGLGNDVLRGDGGNDVLVGDAGADDFYFGPGNGADIVQGFSRAQGDDLFLDDALWGGDLSAAQVVGRYARVVDGDVLFRFADGDTIRLDGVNTLNGLATAIEIF